ncbi:MAG: Gp19/Gp15/Gp42 family protein [Coriobacteriales bacterium]|nr:Gp19/Gp15/Gp42 family protein [Coriobacteriales bacterium]
MAQHATLEDLRALWPGGDLDGDRAATVLSLVSDAIDALCESAGVDVTKASASALRLVTCQAALRMLKTSDAGFGVTQESWGATPYSGSMSFANPTGDLYLTKTERQLLGLDADWAGYVSPKVPE